ncbi:hypothetical protein MBLNU13_g09729t1 [Cladosporium sp. NU13]
MSSTSSKEVSKSQILRASAAVHRAEEKLSLHTETERSSSKEPSIKFTTIDNFAHSSLIARDQLLLADARSSKSANKVNKREVTIGRVDREAGLLLLKYIKNNNIHYPGPITHDLFPTDSTLALRCRVHHACNVFRIPRQLCGDDFRDRLCFDIRQLPTVTCADLALVSETSYLDAGLMNVMQNKITYHTLRGWGSNYVERINAIFEKLQADAGARGKVFNSGWCAEGVTLGQSSGAGKSMVMPTRPKNIAAGSAGKAPVVSSEATAQGQGARGHSAQVDDSEDEETTFIRPSTAGPPLDLSTAPRTSPNKLTGNARATSTSSTKTILKPSKATSSADVDRISWAATETTSPKKSYGNVGGIVGAIKAAAGLSEGKGKLEVAVPETKKEGKMKGAKEAEEAKDDEDEGKQEHGKDSGKGKGKDNITLTETTPSAGSPSTPSKMSYAQILARNS